MINIPTELLRTLIAVVDLRSFTKAAQSLRVTQPAVSAQIKRLQALLGAELLDKSAPGVSLTSAGEIVVNYARRLLSINDQILGLASPNAATQTLRIGMTSDFAAPPLVPALARARASHSDLRFTFRCGNSESLFRFLQEAEIDLVIALSSNRVMSDARHQWTDEMVWVRGPALDLESGGAVPIVSYDEDCIFYRTAVAALNRAGLRSQIVFSGSTIAGLCAAVAAGLGVMVLPRSRLDSPDLQICDDPHLPRLPEVSCGIYLREGAGREIREQVAQLIADVLRPRSPLSQRPNVSAQPAPVA